MFSAILFVEDQSLSHALEQLATESKQVEIQRCIDQFPSRYELARLLNTFVPEIIFVDLTDWTRALPLCDAIHTHSPETAIIGFGDICTEHQATLWTHAGVATLLISPVNSKKFRHAIEQAIHRVRPAMQDNLIAFLPSKAGSGCSTVAFNVAGCLAEEHDRKVLLIEGDLHSGILSVLVDVQPVFSVRDALDHAAELDFSNWNKYIVRAQGIDLLLTRRNKKDPVPSWSNYHQLLQFAMNRYDAILVDLPEVVNEATSEIVTRAWCVYTVCTPEPASLALAEQRLNELECRDITSDRIRVLVNRWHESDPKPEEIEQRLRYPVSSVFHNDYQAVRKATSEFGYVDRECELGKGFQTFTNKLLGIAAPEEPQPRRRFGFLRALAGKALMPQFTHSVAPPSDRPS
ncbi:MAG: AAA family ATPase [Acidobacteria bacterium]|nr:AAA family ATPase [Acidobacteriota bacterium]